MVLGLNSLLGIRTGGLSADADLDFDIEDIVIAVYGKREDISLIAAGDNARECCGVGYLSAVDFDDDVICFKSSDVCGAVVFDAVNCKADVAAVA